MAVSLSAGTPNGGTPMVYTSSMKSTIYVPDDLWAKAKELAPTDTNPSQLVRTALAEWVDAIAPRRLEAFEAPVDEELFDNLIFVGENLRREAQAVYGRGYKAGVTVAEKLNWSDFEALSEVSFDVSLWAEPIRERAGDILADIDDPEKALLAITGELR